MIKIRENKQIPFSEMVPTGSLNNQKATNFLTFGRKEDGRKS